MTSDAFRARRLVISLPLMALGCSADVAPTANGSDLEGAIDREAGKLIEQGVSNCFVIGVVKRARAYAIGFADPRLSPTPNPDGNSIFQIGSLTKLFTVATLLSLAEDGIVSLDDTLTQSLGDQIQLSPCAGAITLRQLASHTSGLPLVPQMLMALPRDDADPYSQLSREAVYDYLRTAEGLRPPGRIAYSNYGMGLLGHILEDRAGASLEHLMATRILAPLSMSATFMTPHEGPAMSLVPGVSEGGVRAATWRFGALNGAGGLCSSVNDMLAFIQAYLTLDGPLASLWRAMEHERGPNGARLGWMPPSIVDRIAGNRAIVWHNGRVGGYASYLSIDVAQRTGVVILSAKSAELTMPGVMLTRAVREDDWRNGG